MTSGADERRDDGERQAITRSAPTLRGPVTMNQDWRDLTFLHWAVAPRSVELFMPPGVRPDSFEGRTYVGLIPFRMVDAGFGRRQSVPWAGTFLETNVRLYSVDRTGRRGIVFLSLDTDRLVVVAGARAALGLPYRWARMSHAVRDRGATQEHTYQAKLRCARHGARSRVTIRVGAPRTATPLDDFVSARWGLHHGRFGRTTFIPNAHDPWPLREAEVVHLDDELVRSVGLGDLASRPPDHVAFSSGVHAEFGRPTSATKPLAH